MSQVCLDIHDALGIKWGDDPYNAIKNLGKTKGELIYLATPFHHKDKAVMDKRFDVVTKIAADFMCQGIHVYSPISHCYPMAKVNSLPTGWGFWNEFDRKIIRMCTKLIVVKQAGWDVSEGVKAEIGLAEEFGIPVEYMDYKDEESVWVLGGSR
jgi:hypothetical protein